MSETTVVISVERGLVSQVDVLIPPNDHPPVIVVVDFDTVERTISATFPEVIVHEETAINPLLEKLVKEHNKTYQPPGQPVLDNQPEESDG